jgi:hypothetical protein
VNTYLPALSPLTRNRDAVCCTAVPKYAVLSVFHTLISTRACTLLLCHATDLRSSRGATTADSHTATHAQSSHTSVCTHADCKHSSIVPPEQRAHQARKSPFLRALHAGDSFWMFCAKQCVNQYNDLPRFPRRTVCMYSRDRPCALPLALRGRCARCARCAPLHAHLQTEPHTATRLLQSVSSLRVFITSSPP